MISSANKGMPDLRTVAPPSGAANSMDADPDAATVNAFSEP